MDILEKIEEVLAEGVSGKELSRLNNQINKDMFKITSLVKKSNAYPDQKKSYEKQMGIVYDEYMKAFDILTDIVQSEG